MASAAGSARVNPRVCFRTAALAGESVRWATEEAERTGKARLGRLARVLGHSFCQTHSALGRRVRATGARVRTYPAPAARRQLPG
jgi:hypothetical protein